MALYIFCEIVPFALCDIHQKISVPRNSHSKDIQTLPPFLTVSELRLEMVRDNAEIYRPVLTMDPGTDSGQRRPRLKLFCTVLVLYCTVD